MSLIQINHNQLKKHLKPGDYAIDATAGNGHDTLKLAQYVSPGGQILAIDIQDQAIKNTQALLNQHTIQESVTLIKENHQNLESILPQTWHKKVKAIVFNLGYLPGSDKSVITETNSTIKALDSSLNLLSPNGILSVMLYPGHSGGDDETNHVKNWAKSLDHSFKIEFIQAESKSLKAPVLLLIHLTQ